MGYRNVQALLKVGMMNLQKPFAIDVLSRVVPLLFFAVRSVVLQTTVAAMMKTGWCVQLELVSGALSQVVVFV